MRFAPEYVSSVLTDNFEDAKALLLTPLMAIHHAHLVMLAEQGIVSSGRRTGTACRARRHLPRLGPQHAVRRLRAKICSSTSNG